MEYCYLNGHITTYDQCRLHISDLQIQRGYGVFDFFRVRGGQIPWLEDYTGRLFNSIRLSGIGCDLTREGFTAAIHDLLQRNGDGESAFKVLVTGGYSGNLESVTGSANVVILQVPWEPLAPESFQLGVGLVSEEYVRPNPEIKTLYYFNTLRLQEKMKAHRAVDVLYHQDLVTECSRASVFFVKDGNIFTTRTNILTGIIRKQVLSAFGEIRLEDFAFEHLFGVDEIFITSTSRDITPVVSVDGRKIGNGKPGPFTREIQATFLELERTR